jgi:sugar O-acyltransferase (sialic acid O-acetyltransferase NeuD family)
MSNKLIIVGTGGVADIMSDYFMRHTSYEIVCFSVDDDHKKETAFKGLPIISFEEVDRVFPPESHSMFVAIGYMKLNYIRARFYKKGKELGYKFISYVSPHALLHPTVTVGENTFIFEYNNIQYNAKIGNDVILWSSNHIGHETTIKDHAYLASHVVISGYCEVGEYSFLGVNVTFADEVKLGSNCLVGAGSYIARSTENNLVFPTTPTPSKTFDDISKKAQDMWRPDVE